MLSKLTEYRVHGTNHLYQECIKSDQYIEKWFQTDKMFGRTDERTDDTKTISLQLLWGIKNKCVSVMDLKFLGRVGTHLFFFLFLEKNDFMHFERQKAFKMHKIHIFSRKTVFFIFYKQ